MSYANPVEASSKLIYASVLNGFYTDAVFNPATNTMTSVSTFPIEASMMSSAIADGMNFAESLTCATQNPAFNCSSNFDCPGRMSQCGQCIQNKCRQ